jgi:hypothetical protein
MNGEGNRTDVLDHPAWPPLAAIGGSIIDSAGLENAGHAEVDGFYRFPSFGRCEGERCQRGYSAFKIEWFNNRKSLPWP